MLAPLLLLALCGAPADFPHAYAQTKAFTRGLPQKVRIAPDGTVFFLESGPRSATLSLNALDPGNGKSRELVTPAQLLGGTREHISVEEQARRERMRQTEQGFTEYALSRDGSEVLLPLSGKVFVLERKSGAIRRVYVGDDAAIDPQLSPDGTRVAYVRSNDLFVADVASGKELRLTTGGSDDLTHGLAEFIAQEELGRAHGFWWSPDGKTLAFEEADSRAVEHFTISDPSKPAQPGNHFAYPRAGKANAKLRIGLVPAVGGAVAWLSWDEKWPYLSEVLWPEGAAAPTLEVRSRDQRDLAYLRSKNGVLAAYFTEHDDAWIDPTDCPRGVEACGPVVTPEGAIVRIAEMADGHALQVVGASGKATRITPAGFHVSSLLAADAENAYVLGGLDPLDEPVWQVPLHGFAPGAAECGGLCVAKRLTPGIGEHTPYFTPGASLFADSFTDATHRPKVSLRRLDGTVMGADLPVQAEKPPFSPNAEFAQVEAKGHTFQVVLLRPHDFDKRKRYPVIDSVYGGPTANVVVRSEASLLLDQWYADHGFIVVRIDNRGTPRRGRAWAKALVGDFGDIPLDDQIDALHALGKRYRELDTSRIGVSGWSFGGYLSALAVLKRPDVFKCAVAGAPVVDWTDYDTAYTERYLRTPQSNPDGYAKSSLLTYAAKLERPMLLVHGTADDNVYFFNSLKLLDVLFHNAQVVDFLPLVGQTHILSDPDYRERLYRRTARYFSAHLGAPKR